MSGCEEVKRNSISVSDRMDSLVCPKPRRLGVASPSINDHFRSLRYHVSHQTEICESKAGTELLDIILSTGCYGAEKSGTPIASSPPFFFGSPPSRASNPVIQDSQFGNDKLSPLSPSQGGCIRVKLGHKPATVRIEGFDCLGRDTRNCSISAVA